VFQRFYVWGKEELEALEDDIDTADPAIGQFLGAIVLKDLGRPAGPTSPSTYLLIDGQQRLTTLYLLLLNMATIAYNHGHKDGAEFIWQNYLVETKSPQYRGWPKLVPTLQDRHTFYEILKSALPDFDWDTTADPEDKKPRSSRKLIDQWNRLTQYLEEATGVATGALDQQSFDKILTTVQEHLRIIDITLEAQDDANATFSRLNAKGVPLELADLVRNEVFSKFTPNETAKADKFYLKYWQPFEKSIPDGSISAFFPVYAYIALHGKVTKAAAFGALQKAWKSKSPAAVLSDLQRYSPFFAALTEYTEPPTVSKAVNAQVERFSRMPRTRVTWPFIIQALRAVEQRLLDETHALRSLRIVESFLVRRALVGREPTGLHAVFKTLWDKTKGVPDEVRKSIVTRTILSPGDEELRAFLKKERSDSRVILNFVLAEYERAIIKANKYDPPPHTVATIEHVLPQNLTEEWAKTFTQNEHEKFVGLLGNLVPLSETQNKSVKDQPWEQKSKRFIGSNFKTTQEIAPSANWSAAQINKRTDKLISWMTETWPELSAI